MNARDVAFLTLRDVTGDAKRQAQTAFEYRCSRADLDERDRAFAGELAYGSIKARRLIDWYLRPYIGDRLKTLPPTIVDVLRLGVYQLRCMGGVEAHAAVHETVNLAMHYGHRGTAGLVNAVLRRLLREEPPAPEASAFDDHEDFLATKYSLPTWIVRIFASRFSGDTLEAVVAGVNERPQLSVTFDTRRCDAQGLIDEFAARGLNASCSAYVAQTLVLAGAGARLQPPTDERYFPQSESAAMAVDLLAPEPTKSVIEFCAGRGNKTLQLAMRIGGEAAIDAIELDERKAAVLGERLGNAKIRGVNVHSADALFYAGAPADAVLVDAPCSAIGVVGRNPEARWRKDKADATLLQTTQREMLRHAFALLKPGGRIVYSVCSVDRRECEDVLDAVRADIPFDVVPLPERYAEFRLPEGYALIPPGIAGRDGFFAAVLRPSGT